MTLSEFESHFCCYT